MPTLPPCSGRPPDWSFKDVDERREEKESRDGTGEVVSRDHRNRVRGTVSGWSTDHLVQTLWLRRGRGSRSKTSGGATLRPGERFRIVLSWLEDDTSGKDTKSVATALRNVGGIELMRSARIVEASGARDKWLPAMQQSGAVLEDWHADLAILGEVKESQRSLNLWLVPRERRYAHRPAFSRDLGEDVGASGPTVRHGVGGRPRADTEVRGRAVGSGLRDATEKLAGARKPHKVAVDTLPPFTWLTATPGPG